MRAPSERPARAIKGSPGSTPAPRPSGGDAGPFTDDTAPPRSTPLPAVARSAYDVDNGLIRVRMNDHAPIITQLWVDGVLAVPHDNIGADFQMTARSDKGDGYNPTQGGDCSGTPSLVNSVDDRWNALDPSRPSPYGLLFSITPRNYNEPSYPGCLGPGALLPYDMRFGFTLGDGATMPRSLMLLDMSIGLLPQGSPEPVVKALSELPVVFLDNARYRYAYYSADTEPADGLAFRPMRAGATHDSRAWPLLTNYFMPGESRAIMLCDRPDAVERPDDGACFALYANEGVTVQASHRQGALHDLTLITTIGIDASEPRITDGRMRTQRRLVAVGTPTAVSSGIAWAAQHLPREGWSRW